MKKKLIFAITVLSALLAFSACELLGDNTSHNTSSDFSSPETSVQVSEEPGDDISENSEAEASDEASEEASGEVSDEISTETSEEVSTETSTEESEEVSEEVSEEPLPTEERTAEVENYVQRTDATFSGLEKLTQIKYTVYDADNLRGLDSSRIDHGFGAGKDGKPHNMTVENQKRFDSYGTNALTWDNKTEEKILYLTFDCGYKYEDLLDRILDTLKEKSVPAAFFCTIDFMEYAPDDINRMISEGHIVGNHSVTHPTNCASLSREKMAWELLGAENYLRENFGYSSKYFRFPSGVYSESALEIVDSVGYRSVFWSIAHADWDPENQPGVDVSFATVTGRLHPGAVILLHSTSPDNADILADFIEYAWDNGYTFRSLDEYEYWS